MLSGLLLVDKPAGWTSFRVVRRIRRLLGVRKVGHLGTLDPFATGLLPLAVGEATKLTPYLLEEPKVYLATLKLGAETDTQDLTGRVVATSEHLPAEPEIRQVAARFEGQIEQVPPLFSAVHYQGERLYKLARRGVKVSPPARLVTIFRLEVREVALPFVTLWVRCSKGTYIRTLAHDLGRALGCGAHLAALRRLEVGPFRVEAAVNLEDLEQTGTPEILVSHLLPLAACLPHWPVLEVGEREARRLATGQPLPCPGQAWAEGTGVRVLWDNSLVAVARVRQQQGRKLLLPERVLALQAGPRRHGIRLQPALNLKLKKFQPAESPEGQ